MVEPGIPSRRNTLPRPERLGRSAEYQAAFERGRSVHGSLLVLFFLREPSRPRRVGFVAGRRVGTAVRRNRAKRLMREAWRLMKTDLPPDGFSAVLVARRGCEESSLASVRDELSRLLARALGNPVPADPAPGASLREP